MKLTVALGIDGTVRRRGLEEDEPVPRREVDDEVGELPVFVELQTEIRESLGFEHRVISTSVADV